MKTIALLIFLCFLGSPCLAQEVTEEWYNRQIDSLEAEKMNLLEQVKEIESEISKIEFIYSEHLRRGSIDQFQEDIDRATDSAYAYAKKNDLPFVIHDIRRPRNKENQTIGLILSLRVLPDKKVTNLSFRLSARSRPLNAFTDTLEVNFDLPPLDKEGVRHLRREHLWKYSEDIIGINLIDAKVSYESGKEQVIPELFCISIPYLPTCE